MSRDWMRRVICIDGLAATGKGTLARSLQQRLGWNLLDSGALYRSVALLGREAGLDPRNLQGHVALAETMELGFAPGEDRVRVVLGGEDRTDAVRAEDVSALAAVVAAQQPVRDALLQRQHGFAGPPGLIADGRDMGTKVFPRARIKFFLSADAEERARRRILELGGGELGGGELGGGELGGGPGGEPGRRGGADRMGGPPPPGEEIRRHMEDRDRRDTEREVSRTEAAADAVVLDTTDMTAVQVLDRALDVVRGAMPDALSG